MDKQNNVKKSHSSYVNKPKESHSREECKSDMNIISSKNSSYLDQNKLSTKHVPNDCHKYTYAYDEVPVKDDGNFNDRCFSEGDSGRGDNKITIDEIEMKIFKKISQELQTDDKSISSLDSNIKIFKTTVNHILDNFYANMQDFEVYKKKFHEILEKNKGDSIVEMEDFIKDMIQHIGSSESSASDSKFTDVKEYDEKTKTQDVGTEDLCLKVCKASNSLNSTIEAFKNENYLTDSTFEQNSSKFNSTEKKGEYLNIFLLSGTRYVEIKMNDRSLFSEINIRDEYNNIKEPLASAENIKKLEAKKLQLEKYVKEQEQNLKDREIPVKNSNAKKNIHLDEDFLEDDKEDCHKFFIFRICNYICRKIRKNAFGQ